MGKTQTGNNIVTSAEESKPPESISLILTNCGAFLAITFIIVGELMHEQNMWAVLLIGGGLCSMNALLTSLRIERRSKQSKKDRFEASARSRNSKEMPHRSQVYVGDAISIDIDSLSDENYRRPLLFDVIEDGKERHPRNHRKSSSKHLKIRLDKPKRRDGRSSKKVKDDDSRHRKRESRRQRENVKPAGRDDVLLDLVDKTEKSCRKKKKRKTKKVRLAPEYTVVEI